MESLLALLEERFGDAVTHFEACGSFVEPEMLFYFARHFAYMERGGEALQMIGRAADAGFVCAPQTLRNDPWLESVRAHSWFGELLRDLEERVQNARTKWLAWESGLKHRRQTAEQRGGGLRHG